MWLHDVISSSLVRYLMSQGPSYQRKVPVDMNHLKGLMQPGDILLVEGGARISQVIKYLTQSSWSHAAFYVGDGLLRWGGPNAEASLEAYGAEAAHLLVESDMKDGVIGVPLTKYENHNLRICRPIGLKPEDLDRVIAELLRHLGVSYDQRNVLDLARYLTPFHFLPARFRRKPLYLGSSTSREVICSALIAKAFYKVDFAIQPLRAESGSFQRKGGWAGRHPSYIMPRDFDLSPNFDILKPVAASGGPA